MADHTLALSAPDMLIYQGDSLPSFAGAVEDSVGNPIDLTTADAAFLQLRHPDGTLDEHECTIVSGTDGIVTFDWTAEITSALAPGRHAITVRVEFDDGDELTAPSDDRARVTVRPALSDPT